MNKHTEPASVASQRTKQRLVIVALAVGLLTVISACSSTGDKGRVATNGSSSPSSGVPPGVEGVGHYGENLYDLAKSRDWAKAAADLVSLRQSLQQLGNETKDKGAERDRLSRAVDALELAIRAKDRAIAMREANLVTLIGADLAAAFNPPVPIEVAKLDYFGRELEIWSEAGNEVKLREIAKEIASVWLRLQPMVRSAGGGPEARNFSELVGQLDVSLSSSDFKKLVAPFLDEVDNLEKVFTKK